LSFHIPAYDGLQERLESMGYRAGDWNAPRGAGEYVYFPFDWRQSVESSGRRFHAAMRDLYRRIPPDTPRAIVIGHSLGGLVARYALMYGDAALGDSGPLPDVNWGGADYMRHLFLVATPNEGTFASLKSLEQGVTYFHHYGAFSPQVMFSFPAVFDVIPGRLEPLLDREGRPLPFRLDRAEDWEMLGWSVFPAPGRLDGTIPGAPGSRKAARLPPVWRAHLAKELNRSARL